MKGVVNTRESIQARLEPSLEHVYDGTPCLRWTGQINSYGYGKVSWQGKPTIVHRLVFYFETGSWPIHTLDHLCRNRWCGNRLHLDDVPIGVNTLRSPIAAPAVNARKTHCPQGHPYADWNIKSKRRRCRECNYKRRRDWVAARRESFNARRRENYAKGLAA